MGTDEVARALAIVKEAGYVVRRESGNRETYEGVLTVHRWAKHRPRRNEPKHYPPVGWLAFPESFEHPRGWQVRFARLPADLHGCNGHRVRVVCTPRDWGNGVGTTALRPRATCLDEEEHILAALASLGTAER